VKNINLLIYILIVLILNSCVDIKDNYSTPTWDADLNIPLTNREYSVDELAKQSKYITIDSSSDNYFLVIQTDTLHERYGLNKFTDDRLNISIDEINIPLNMNVIDLPISYPEGVEVDSAQFYSGNLNFKILNTSANVVSATIFFPNYLVNGVPISIDINIPANGTFEKSITLTNISYTSSVYTDKSKFLIKIMSGNIAGEIIKFSMNISQTKFTYISGLIPARQLDDINSLMSMQITDKIRNLRDKLSLYNTELIFSANYLSDISDLFDILLQNTIIKGVSLDNQVRYFTKNGQSNLGEYLIEKGKFYEKFDNSNTNVSEFISFLPDTIKMNSQVYMNPYNKRGSARMTDSFDVKVIINALGMIAAEDVEYTDTVHLELSSENRTRIIDAKQAKITIETENEIPVGTNLTAYFCNNDFLSLFEKNAYIDPATANSEGISSSPSKNKIVIDLNGDEIKKLAETFVIIVKLKLSTYDSKNIALRAFDKIKIKAYCSLKYNINN
jgi:hypothetical protein